MGLAMWKGIKMTYQEMQKGLWKTMYQRNKITNWQYSCLIDSKIPTQATQYDIENTLSNLQGDITYEDFIQELKTTMRE